MAAFGLGMVPMLVLSAAAAAGLKNRLNQTYGRKLTAIVLILSGAVTLAAPLVMQCLHANHTDHANHAEHMSHGSQQNHEGKAGHADSLATDSHGAEQNSQVDHADHMHMH